MSGLTFGLNGYLVEGTRAAWGARWIVTQHGDVDQLHDRQSSFGEVEPLIAWLNGGANKAAREKASELLRDRKISTREGRPFVLYADKIGAFLANTNGSGGYLYVTAYRYADLPAGHKTRGFEIVDKKEES